MSDPVSRLNAALEGRYAIERELGEGGVVTAARYGIFRACTPGTSPSERGTRESHPLRLVTKEVELEDGHGGRGETPMD